jgi:hypothetical protein
MLHRKKIVVFTTIAIASICASARASIQPSSILGQVLGGSTSGSLIDRVLAQTTIDDEFFGILTEASNQLSSAKGYGLDSLNTAAGAPVFREDGGIDLEALLNKGQQGGYSIADSTRTSPSTASNVDTGYVLHSATVQTSREAVVANSKTNKKLSKLTTEVLKDAAATYNEVASTSPKSSLEGIEQANQVSIANGAITAQNTKTLQSVNRSTEISNALKIAELSDASSKKLIANIDSSVGAMDSKKARSIYMRRRPVVN